MCDIFSVIIKIRWFIIMVVLGNIMNAFSLACLMLSSMFFCAWRYEYLRSLMMLVSGC